jgi:2-amino-4-hydroxy-6-hydroxymethyldihydropteridine diphosphokinase
MHLRKFVLAPLAEIAPNLVHPTLHKEIHEILEELQDETYVARWNPNLPQGRLATING